MRMKNPQRKKKAGTKGSYKEMQGNKANRQKKATEKTQKQEESGQKAADEKDVSIPSLEVLGKETANMRLA